ncbi:tetratricopeptide repeat protein [Laspinema olomoucense]|uniref:Tetratricopeptide repeat protein n=1 Tax=Laspinema olomoucense D3b TaxID=2953688 RepID=A0ABT2NGR4_9CYAN|nr:tetratricopeptide repeat protein [Laspinema sp. D3b]MCT7980525.1 tetratricopeptide repeat protein [Laspinema sp. D3b]
MKKIRQFFVVISIASISSSLLFNTVKLFGSYFQQAPTEANTEVTSAASKLADQARGYELVLQREPKNQIALEGLAKVRIELNDLPGAMETLEQLIRLNGDRENYKKQLAQIKHSMSH